MKKVVRRTVVRSTDYGELVARWLLGLSMIFFGLNGLFQFMSPPPTPAAAEAFWAGLMSTGYFMPLLALTHLIPGILLVIRRAVPLALIILAPMSLNIVLYHIFLDPATMLMGAIVALLNLYLGIKYVDAYRPLFR